MKKLITTLTNIWKIEDLRNRILYTLLILLIYRVGCHVVLPGVNPEALVVNRGDGGNDLPSLQRPSGGTGGFLSRALSHSPQRAAGKRPRVGDEQLLGGVFLS